MPQLTGTDSLNLGSTYSLEVSDGLGGAQGVIGLGFGPASQSSIPIVGGTLLVNPVDVWIPFVLDGVVGVPSAGSFSYHIPIPVNASLLGFNLNAQAGMFDAGATFGISLTNGVEAWIL